MLQQLRTYGIFFGIVLGMAAVLVVASLAVRGSWERGLAETLQDALDRLQPESYVVAEPIDLRSAYETDCAAFRLSRKDAAAQADVGILLRVPTLAGAMPAVFLRGSDGSVAFAGYAIPCGRAEPLLDARIHTKSLRYWERQLETLLNHEQTEKKP